MRGVGARAFLGGFNIHRENSRRAYGERRWRDTHVEVGDPLAGDLSGLFGRYWEDDPPD